MLGREDVSVTMRRLTRWVPAAGRLECMRLRSRVRAGVATALVATLAGVAVVLSAGVASAETARVVDALGDVAHPVDISTVTVRHTDRAVVVRVRHEDLRRRGSAGLSVFVDSDAARNGPEFVLGGGLFEGTDYLLTGARGWRSDNRVVECSYRMRVNWDRDLSVVRMDRGCFDDAERVRVAVRASGETEPGSTQWVTDWAGEARWGDWLSADSATTPAVA